MNAFNIILTSLRQLHLAILLILSIYLPFRIPHVSPLAPLDTFDVFIVDQLSICVPVLRWMTRSRVIFYCHFPDKLLSGGWEFSADHVGRARVTPGEKKRGTRGPGLLKRLYRWPFDKLEEVTTGRVFLGSIRVLRTQTKKLSCRRSRRRSGKFEIYFEGLSSCLPVIEGGTQSRLSLHQPCLLFRLQ